MSLSWFHHHAADPQSSAPPTGCKFALSLDPMAHDFPIAGSAFFEIVENGDGSSSLKTKSGQYISQNPMARGSFALANTIGLYEKFGIAGNLVTSWTRPDQGDPIYTYCLVALPNAA
jgi:hypothetical protein